MLIEVMLVFLFVSITCCSLLTGYKACVLAMQQFYRLDLAIDLLEVSNVEAADALAAELGLFIERKEFIDKLQIKQEIITVRECRNQKVLVNKVRYALSEYRIFISRIKFGFNIYYNDEPAVCGRGATAAAGLAAYTV